MFDHAQKAHDLRMKHDPVYRGERERRQRLREKAAAEYKAAVDRLNRMTDDELWNGKTENDHDPH